MMRKMSQPNMSYLKAIEKQVNLGRTYVDPSDFVVNLSLEPSKPPGPIHTCPDCAFIDFHRELKEDMMAEYGFLESSEATYLFSLICECVTWTSMYDSTSEDNEAIHSGPA